jgi:hypothetical protein
VNLPGGHEDQGLPERTAGQKAGSKQLIQSIMFMSQNQNDGLTQHKALF